MASINSSVISRHLEKFRKRLDAYTAAQLKKYESSQALQDKFADVELYRAHLQVQVEIKFAQGRKKIYDSLPKAKKTVRFEEPAPEPIMPTSRPGKEINVDAHWPYKVLDLPLFTGHMSQRKTNIAAKLSLETAGAPPDWSAAFADPTRDLMVDVGCGVGRFLLRSAWEQDRQEQAAARFVVPPTNPAVPRNYLGIEIREGLVVAASEHAQNLGLSSICQFAHANVTAEVIRAAFSSYPGRVVMFLFQLPDPRLVKNMRRSGAKRLTKTRVLSAELCTAVTDILAPGAGMVYASSDYMMVAEEMGRLCMNTLRLRPATEKETKAVRILDVPLSDRAFFGPAPLPDAPLAARVSSLSLDDNRSASHEKEKIIQTTPSDVSPPVPPVAAQSDETCGADEMSFQWLPENPFGLPTGREVFLAHSGRRQVHRSLFVCKPRSSEAPIS